MSGWKNSFVMAGFVCAASLLSCAVCVLLVAGHDSRRQAELLNAVCGAVLEQKPEAAAIISAVLKDSTGGHTGGAAKAGILEVLGYCHSDLMGPDYGRYGLFVAAGFLSGAGLLCISYFCRNKMEARRIRALAEYLEQVNTGKAVILSTSGEDEFSRLEDEIYKTVTYLYQTKDAAVQAKNGFAENLSNIAHQIKTPITAMSLSVQMLKQDAGKEWNTEKKQDTGKKQLEQLEKQLLRLTHLQEALLVLARMDAGTLRMQKDEVDVYTLLVLAADNLQGLSADAGMTIDIPQIGEMMIAADLDWTMEAVMNLMKNCMEHGNGTTIRCSYAQNPFYTEIFIQDNGDGFRKEDLPHLFERFYRGQNADPGGIGIGLALSREIVERQNGTIRAKNMPDGGACFEIRFYSQCNRSASEQVQNRIVK